MQALRNLGNRGRLLVCDQLKGGVRLSHGHGPPKPGDNLPFDIHNKYKLTFWYIVFVASGLSIPFIALRHQLLKQRG